MTTELNKYTVVGYYESSGTIFNAHVTAKDECDAVPKVLPYIHEEAP